MDEFVWLVSGNECICVTLNVQGPSYLGLTRSISWLLMPWLFTSLGHQQPWYDYVEYVYPGLTWERISCTCVISMWRNDIKCKYMFMFTLKNLARKELRVNHYNDELIFKMHEIDKHFLSLLDTAMAQVVELIPFEGQWVYIEYHGCWYPDASRNKGNSSYIIICPKYCVFSNRMFKS